jgi:biotin operon repressor
MAEPMQGRPDAAQKGETAMKDAQVSLLAAFDEPAQSGENVPASREEAQRISGARSQVKAVMADGDWHTLPNIAAELKRRFGARYMETAISAYVRELRRKGYHVDCEPTRAGSNLYHYRARLLTTEEIAERARRATFAAQQTSEAAA